MLWSGSLNEENNIPDKAVLFATGNIIENKGIRNQIGTKTYDVVVANILADVITSVRCNRR